MQALRPHDRTAAAVFDDMLLDINSIRHATRREAVAPSLILTFLAAVFSADLKTAGTPQVNRAARFG